MDLNELLEKVKAHTGIKDGWQSQIAKDLGLSSVYVSKAFTGWDNYKLSDEKKAEVEERITTHLLSFLETQVAAVGALEAEIISKGFLPLNNTVLIIKAALKAVKRRELLKVCGFSGAGKTTAVGILSTKLNCAIALCFRGITARDFMQELGVKTGAISENDKRSTPRLVKEVASFLKDRNIVVFVDEANFLPAASLEQIRHIWDVSQTPIILVGTEELDKTLYSSHPQVINRVRAAPALKKMTEEEAAIMLRAAGVDEKHAPAALRAKRGDIRATQFWLEDLREYAGAKAIDDAIVQKALKEL